MAAGAVLATGITEAAVAATTPVPEPEEAEPRMTLERIRLALVNRMEEAAQAAYLEVERIRQLTGQEPALGWVSDVAIDCGMRSLADVDLERVKARILEKDLPDPDGVLVCGVNREHDYVWVRPAETGKRGANGAPANVLKLSNAASFYRPLFEG